MRALIRKDVFFQRGSGVTGMRCDSVRRYSIGADDQKSARVPEDFATRSVRSVWKENADVPDRIRSWMCGTV